MMFRIRLYFIRFIKFLIICALFFLIVSTVYAQILGTNIDSEWFKALYPERFFDALILALLLPFFKTYKKIKVKVEEPDAEVNKLTIVLDKLGYEPEKHIHADKLYQFRLKNPIARFFTLNENRIFLKLDSNHIEFMGQPKKVSKVMKHHAEIKSDIADPDDVIKSINLDDLNNNKEKV